MNILIQIHYISSDSRLMRRGAFPLRGKSKEEVALTWWKQVQREMPYGADLEQIIVDGEDITEVIIKMI